MFAKILQDETYHLTKVKYSSRAFAFIKFSMKLQGNSLRNLCEETDNWISHFFSFPSDQKRRTDRNVFSPTDGLGEIVSDLYLLVISSHMWTRRKNQKLEGTSLRVEK